MSQGAHPRRDLGDSSGKTALVDGSVVGGYQLSFLAVGGMSVVYKGEKLGKTVVLKEVPSSSTHDVPYLVSEKNLLERLSHPGLISYHSFFSERGYYYLVVEYVPGRPLSQFLTPNSLATVDDVADWAVQLCDVLGYLHRQKPPIIYRDLKPENIMLINGRIKLIDFGIARLHKGGERDKDTELLGSTVTASPEHFGGSETDARSDIYTLGATIYDLLTGGQRKKVGAFAFAPVRELRPEVPPALEAALVKSLEFKPADRFGSAPEMGNAILVAMGKQPKSDPAQTAQIEVAPAPTRGRFRLALVLILLAAGAGLGILLNKFAVAPLDTGYPPSTGVQEASLKGDLFAAGKMTSGPVVFMGEDVGLFQVTSWKEESAFERADTIATRLNRFYRTACLKCGGSNLESPDIRVGRYKETGEVVIFYAHIHGSDPPAHGPLLLATVDEDQAKALQRSARFVAYYWRDMVRDIIDLSRGFPVKNSALGVELAGALSRARGQLKAEGSSVENLRQILRQSTGAEALKLRELFLRVPERKPSLDSFVNVKGYEPLRD